MTKPATVVVNVNDVQALRALDNIARKFADVGRRIQSIGKTLSLAGGAASAPFGISSQVFADTDDALRAVGVISGSTEKEMAKLRETAKSFKTFVPKDAASEMLKLAQAGLTAKDSMEAVAATLALQRIDPELGNQASEIVTKIAIPFGKTARDFEHIADILAVASARSTTSVGNLGIAMGYAANQGDLAGLSIEQAAAAMAILADNGIDASRAGTNLRGILSTLVAKQKKFAELGVRILDDAGEVRKIEEIFGDLNKAMEGLGGGERLTILTDIFGKLYSGGAAGLLKDAERFNELVAEMETAEGAALRWAEAMDAGAGGAIRSLKKEVLSIAESVGSTLAPRIIEISERFRGYSKSIQGVIEANPGVVQGLAGLAAGALAAGPPLVVLGFSLQQLGVIQAAVAANAARLLTVVNALTAAQTRATAVTVAQTAAYSSLAAAKVAATAAGTGLLAATAAVAALGATLAGLAAGFAASNFFPEFARQSGVMQIVIRGVNAAITATLAVLRSFASIAQRAFNQASAAAQAALRSIGALLDPRKLLRALAALAREIVEPFRNAFRALAEAIGPLAIEAFNRVESAVRVAFAGMVEIVSDAIGYIVARFGPLVTMIGQAIDLASRPFVAAFRIVGREIAAIVGGTISFLSGLATEGARIAGQLAAAFGNIFADVLPSIQLIVDAIQAGNFQQAFELAASAAKYAFLQAFGELEIAWLQLVGYFAKSFDNAAIALTRRMEQAVTEMGLAIRPLASATAFALSGGDQAAAAKAWNGITQAVGQAREQIEGVRQQFHEASREARRAAKSRIGEIRDEMREREAAFNRDRFNQLLPDFLSDVTTGAQRFGAAMQDALGPIGSLLEGMGWRAGEAAVAAAEEAEALFRSQVFGGAAKQVIGQNVDSLGAQQLDVAKEQLKSLKKIEEGVDDLEFAWG